MRFVQINVVGANSSESSFWVSIAFFKLRNSGRLFGAPKSGSIDVYLLHNINENYNKLE